MINLPQIRVFSRSIAATLVCLTASTQAQTSTASKVDAAMRALNPQTIRGTNYDICFPADAAEYEALGKNAILMVRASSAIATELPLKSVYITVKGARTNLQRVHLEPKVEANDKSSQVAFYLLPVRFMKSDAALAADFSGARQGFGMMQFSARALPKEMPAFARLDEYDQPVDADMATIKEVLLREFPDIVTGL
ncbi:hypothetical protein [Sphingomonas antarctica]|uniref:hypothetical protein n=1 Tax=Sphingomonas antarctica TaxID=2040274 RepID=UPI0039ECAD8A